MHVPRRPCGCAILELVLVIVSASPALAAEKPDADTVVNRVLALPSTQRFAGSKALSAIMGERGLLSLLLKEWRVENPSDRGELLELMVNLARAMGPSRCCHYRVHDMRVARVLVLALDDDSREIRSRAASLLAASVHERAVRFHAAEIVQTVGKHGNTDALLLLGRTGSDEARLLLQQDARYGRASRRTTDLALARLGNTELQGEFVQEFLRTESANEQGQIAMDLGYIGSREACQALASQLRTPKIVKGLGIYSLRLTIIDALSRALPGEPILWKPPEAPKDDTYYQGIETWAAIALDSSWEEERPHFFYIRRRIGRPHAPLRSR